MISSVTCTINTTIWLTAASHFNLPNHNYWRFINLLHSVTACDNVGRVRRIKEMRWYEKCKMMDLQRALEKGECYLCIFSLRKFSFTCPNTCSVQWEVSNTFALTCHTSSIIYQHYLRVNTVLFTRFQFMWCLKVPMYSHSVNRKHLHAEINETEGAERRMRYYDLWNMDLSKVLLLRRM